MGVENLPEGVSDTFHFKHVVCGAVVFVVGGVEQPHRCRIEIEKLPSR